MEKLPNSNQENPAENLSPKGKFEVLLTLFGGEQARQNFVSVCREYHTERVARVVSQDDIENYRSKKMATYSPPKRADLHNKIMEIIAKLSVQSKKITPLQKEVLRDFHSRENVASAIKAFVLAEKGATKSGGDELPEADRKNMSDTAYFHSLGREH